MLDIRMIERPIHQLFMFLVSPPPCHVLCTLLWRCTQSEETYQPLAGGLENPHFCFHLYKIEDTIDGQRVALVSARNTSILPKNVATKTSKKHFICSFSTLSFYVCSHPLESLFGRKVPLQRLGYFSCSWFPVWGTCKHTTKVPLLEQLKREKCCAEGTGDCEKR